MQAEAGTAQDMALKAQEEAKVWESLASEAAQSKEQLQASLDALQAQAQASAPNEVKTLLLQAQKAAQQVELDEAATPGSSSMSNCVPRARRPRQHRSHSPCSPRPPGRTSPGSGLCHPPGLDTEADRPHQRHRGLPCRHLGWERLPVHRLQECGTGSAAPGNHRSTPQ